MQSATLRNNKSQMMVPLFGSSVLRALPAAAEQQLENAYATIQKIVKTLAPAPAQVFEDKLEDTLEHTLEPEAPRPSFGR